jgi:carboxylesterase
MRSGTPVYHAKTHDFEAGPVACLLIHGFTGTSFEMKETAEFLAAHNISARAVLLPGHGTSVADLAKIKWTDWACFLREEYQQLRQKHSEIFVFGQSMGGTLALHMATHLPVNGVITCAAPVHYQHRFLRFMPLAQKLISAYPKRHGSDVRDEKMKAVYQTYPAYPLAAVVEFQNVLTHVYDDLPEITAPVKIFHSTGDRTIPVKNAEIIWQRIRSAAKEKTVLTESYHLLTLDVEREKVWQESLNFIRKHSNLLK